MRNTSRTDEANLAARYHLTEKGELAVARMRGADIARAIWAVPDGDPFLVGEPETDLLDNVDPRWGLALGDPNHPTHDHRRGRREEKP